MQELLVRLKTAVLILPGRFGRVEKIECPEYICLDEYIRILNAAVHVALRRKMYDTVDVIRPEDLHHLLSVAYVSLDKDIIRVIFKVFQVLKIACIGQLVNIDDPDITAVFVEHIVNIV